MNLSVVGSVGLDDVETPFGKVELALGGSASYFSLAASFFGRVGFVGIVGDDFPESSVELLRNHDVDVRGLQRVEGKTFRWAGRYGYDLNQRDTLLTELNVFEHFRPELPADYAAAPYLFLANIHPSLQSHVLDQAHGAKFVAMDTMNFWIEGALDDLKKVLARVDCIVLNDSEARQLAKTPNVITAAKAIAAMGPRLVVVKRGEHGAFLYSEGNFFFVPAYPLEQVVDPTGAGDCFAGGFMGLIAASGDTSWATLCHAVVAGSALASFSVENFSVDRFRSLTQGEIQDRIAAFEAMTAFPTRA
jgi:sugar/nucleoside kinase (ribokinase family)